MDILVTGSFQTGRIELFLDKGNNNNFLILLHHTIDLYIGLNAMLEQRPMCIKLHLFALHQDCSDIRYHQRKKYI